MIFTQPTSQRHIPPVHIRIHLTFISEHLTFHPKGGLQDAQQVGVYYVVVNLPVLCRRLWCRCSLELMWNTATAVNLHQVSTGLLLPSASPLPTRCATDSVRAARYGASPNHRISMILDPRVCQASSSSPISTSYIQSDVDLLHRYHTVQQQHDSEAWINLGTFSKLQLGPRHQFSIRCQHTYSPTHEVPPVR